MKIKHFYNESSSGDIDEICYYDADIYDECSAFGHEILVEIATGDNLTDEEVEELIKNGDIDVEAIYKEQEKWNTWSDKLC